MFSFTPKSNIETMITGYYIDLTWKQFNKCIDSSLIIRISSIHINQLN